MKKYFASAGIVLSVLIKIDCAFAQSQSLRADILAQCEKTLESEMVGVTTRSSAKELCRRALGQSRDKATLKQVIGWAQNELASLQEGPARAFLLYAKAAMRGHAPAQLSLGWFHANGLGGLPKDMTKAIEFYTQASAQGLRDSTVLLAQAYEFGEGGVPRDLMKAAEFFEAAAYQYDGPPHEYYADKVLFERIKTAAGGKGFLAKAKELRAQARREAAEQGNVEAQTEWGVALFGGSKDTPKDEAKAAELFAKAAALGHAPAQTYLGVMHEQGKGGLPKDEVKAAALYAQAAEQGDLFARFNLGLMVATGRGGLTKDATKAAQLLLVTPVRDAASVAALLTECEQALMPDLPETMRERAGALCREARNELPDPADARKVFAQARFRIGETIDYSGKNKAEAVRLYQLAAEQGNANAQRRLGSWLEIGGAGLQEDKAKAADLYVKAAVQGEDVFNVATMFKRDGLPWDDPQSIEEIKRDAAQGNAEAQYKLGLLHRYGRGYVPRSEITASNIIINMLENGGAVVLFNIGFAYEGGSDLFLTNQFLEKYKLNLKNHLKASELYSKSAALGYTDAQLHLASIYEKGTDGFPKDEEKAAVLYQLAAQANHEEALLNLGMMHATGRGGFVKDEAKAEELYLRAARESPSMQHHVGMMYAKGRGGLRRDEAKAAALLEQAMTWANRPRRGSMFYSVGQTKADLALLYTEGRGNLPKNDVRAVELLVHIWGEADALQLLGVLYEEGRGGLSRDEVKARELYADAAQSYDSKAWLKGDAEAAYQLALMFERGRTNPPFGSPFSERGAGIKTSGGRLYPSSLSVVPFRIGRLYEKGFRDLPKNEAKAMMFFQIAANNDNESALLHLGWMHLHGRGGLAKDKAKTIELLNKLVMSDNFDAQANLDQINASADDKLPTDLVTAAEYYDQTAARGDARAQTYLGVMHLRGVKGFPRDAVKAAELFTEAAEQGYSYAQFNLGVLYYEGMGGLPEDRVRAAELFTMAAKQGNVQARVRLADMHIELPLMEQNEELPEEFLLSRRRSY